MNPDAFLSVIKEMVKPLQDDHVSIQWGSDEWSPYRGKPTWHPQIRDVVAPIPGVYVPNLQVAASRTVRYGWLSEDVGYLMLASFAVTDEAATDRETLLKAVKSALADLSETSELVVDLRFNEGGYDQVAMAIAGEFADIRRLVYTKASMVERRLGAFVEHYLEPAGTYIRPVTLLTSPLTVSAADVFTLAMKQLPHVRHIGERTAGFFSDSLPRYFPNGNLFFLSHQVYKDPQGNELEGNGCQPDDVIPLRLADANAGRDVALDWILSQRQGQVDRRRVDR